MFMCEEPKTLMHSTQKKNQSSYMYLPAALLFPWPHVAVNGPS